MLLAEDATSEHSENSPLMMRAQSTVSPRRVFVAPSRSSMQQSQPRPMVSHVVDGFDTGNGPFDDELVPAQSPRLPVRERLTSGLNSNQVCICSCLFLECSLVVVVFIPCAVRAG